MRISKAFVILGVFMAGIGLALQWYPASSSPSPGLRGPAPQVTPRPALMVSTTVSLYLPMLFSPPRLYFPLLAKAVPATPTPTVTPTPVPGPVKNGGFEDAGNASGPWIATRIDRSTDPDATEGIDVRTARATLATMGVTPHGGDYASWLDNLEYEIYLQQQITLPTNTSTLTYWAWIKSDEPNCNIDELNGAWVYLITNQANLLESYSLCIPNATTGWGKHTLNISSYAGQTGWLTFVVRNLGQASSLFLDDVAIGNSTSFPVSYDRRAPTPSAARESSHP